MSLLPACLGVLVACGGGEGPTDTAPSGPRERTFVGVLNVPTADSLGGLFQLTTLIATANSPKQHMVELALGRVLDWAVKPLEAQSTTGTATGTLTTNGGVSVPLTGTYAGGAFTVAGSGYSINASVSSTGSLNGTGTAPGGATAAVQPIVVPVTAPAPANPTGTYKGSFTMTTTLKSRNDDTNGKMIGACNYPLTISGTLEMHVNKPGTSDQVDGHLDMRWTEQSAGGSTCPPVFVHNHTDYHGIDFTGTTGVLNPVRTLTGAAGPGNAGTISRTQGFTGAVSGNTVVGTVFLAMSFKTPVSNGTHYESFSPIPRVTVTLTK